MLRADFYLLHEGTRIESCLGTIVPRQEELSRRDYSSSLIGEKTSFLDGLDDEIDGAGEAAPVRGFFFELRAASGGQRVILGSSSGVAFHPLGFDPGFLFEAVEGGIERALLDLEHFIGNLLNALGDGPAVLGLERDGFEDQEVEHALDEIVGFAHTMMIYTSSCR